MGCSIEPGRSCGSLKYILCNPFNRARILLNFTAWLNDSVWLFNLSKPPVLNALHFFLLRFYQDKLSIYCVFLPQIIFLTTIFGYLIIEIFYKWIAFQPKHSYCAPSLLIGLINMFLFKYPKSSDGKCNPNGTFYSGQVRCCC